MNVLSISGNLTKDPELKSTQGGKQVCSLSVAINEGKDKTLFLNCVAWEKTADLISQYCKKGDRFTATGRLDIRSFDDKEGNKRYATEMIIQAFDFPPKAASEPKQETKPSYDIADDSIPF